MRSYSVRKLVPSTVLSFRIVTKCRVTVYVLNIIVGCLSPAFRKIIRLEKPCMNVFPGFSWVQDPQGIISASHDEQNVKEFQQMEDTSCIMFKISIITSTHHSMYTPELQVDSQIVITWFLKCPSCI